MQAYRLIPHPSVSPLQVCGIEMRVKDGGPNWLSLRWRIEGAGKLVVPQITSKSRADGLWQATCFEIFLRPHGAGQYFEWNFSPSRQWNLYAFEGYRQCMGEMPVLRAPDSVWHAGSRFALFDVSIPRLALPQVDCAMAIAAVIEEEGGVKSYWSLAHAEADRPDFHHSACFAALLHPRRSG